jgi:hypothetical protein
VVEIHWNDCNGRGTEMFKMVYVSEAPTVWNLLKGVICIYKPAGITAARVRKILLGNICRGEVCLT